MLKTEMKLPIGIGHSSNPLDLAVITPFTDSTNSYNFQPTCASNNL